MKKIILVLIAGLFVTLSAKCYVFQYQHQGSSPGVLKALTKSAYDYGNTIYYMVIANMSESLYGRASAYAYASNSKGNTINDSYRYVYVSQSSPLTKMKDKELTNKDIKELVMYAYATGGAYSLVKVYW